MNPRNLLFVLLLISAAVVSGCASAADDYSPETIIALEKGALDRWAKGDPQGFYDIMAPDESYFDPLAEKRVDSLEALKAHIAPFAGKFSIDRIDMVNPKVVRDGNVAVLTFNLVDYGAQMNGGKKETSRWNSTEVFRRIAGQWKVVHSHWSYTKPDLTPKP